MQLYQLRPLQKQKKEKRVGRGGKRGTYSGKGTKGQKARAGHRIRPASRDLLIRIPKLRGFKNKSIKSKMISINVGDIESKVKENVITKDVLVNYGLISSPRKEVKILSDGEVKRHLMFKGFKFSKKAKEKIETAGGKIE
ncbi:50S ribosomal protein L15 [Candidatus Wolfebacteria bacterium]|nr:50S ribosomal protein L15 [Candidatus Wolfebacteria bacterium]